MIGFNPLWTSAVILTACLPALCQDAATFRGNPQHSGVYNSPAVTPNQIKWKFHTGGPVISSPAVSSGVVFVGSGDGNLYAVDRESGTLKWKFDAKSRITASAAIADGLVYFGAYNGTFYAVDAATGQLKWKFQTAGERRYAGTHLHGSEPDAESMPDPFDFYLSSPVLWNGDVFFGSGDGNVYALNAASGTLKWRFKTGDVVHASPAIADGKLFVGSWDSYFYALDATSGKKQWRFKTGEDSKIHNQVGIQSSAAVVDGVVYFGCRDSNFYALDAKTGDKKWVFSNHGSWVISSPAVQAGRVYFATSDSGLFYAIDAKTGSPIFTLKFQEWPMFSSPAVAGNMLYIGSHMGKLIAIDLAAQQTSWTFETDGAKQNGATWTKPDGTPNYDAAFGASNFYDDMIVGIGKMMSVGTILSSPVVVDGVIYFGSADGNLYALN
jgi:outer membrane protein assembly factor BamB